MSKGVLIAGLSGSGKSTSLGEIKSLEHIGLNPNETCVINVKGKSLPFKSTGYIEAKMKYNEASMVYIIEKPGNMLNSVNPVEIINYMQQVTQVTNPDGSRKFKNIIIDDFQYIMADEFMMKSKVKGFEKFTDIAANAYFVINAGLTLPNDVIFIILTHSERDVIDGKSFYKIKTIGKMLDEKVTLEGLFTIVLFSDSTTDAEKNSKKVFITNSTEKFEIAKSPIDMFDTIEIPNDLGLVVKKIKEYYNF